MLNKDTVINMSVGEIQAAFAEWDRRYWESPQEFMNEAYCLLFEDEEDYGVEAIFYFLSVLDNLKEI